MHPIVSKVATVATCVLILATWIAILFSWLHRPGDLGLFTPLAILFGVLAFPAGLFATIAEPNGLTRRVLWLSMLWPAVATLTAIASIFFVQY